MAKNGPKLSTMVGVGEKFEIYIRFFSRKHTRQKIEELKVKQDFLPIKMIGRNEFLPIMTHFLPII